LSTNLLINRLPQQSTLPAKKLAILTSALAAHGNQQSTDIKSALGGKIGYIPKTLKRLCKQRRAH